MTRARGGTADDRARPERLAGIPALAAVVARLRDHHPPASGRLLVGLAGAPGAGKSTVAATIAAALPGTAVLPMDGFHLPQSRLRDLGRRDRMGAPDTFDVAGFTTLLATLREVDNSGRTVLAPGFDREIEEPVADAVALRPELSTVIVEGNYLLLDDGGWEAIAPLLHATVGIVVDDAIRRERLIARHIAFGKAPDAARAWALGPDERNAAAIAATLERADYLLSP
ncbi:nucleoside/nucleotide kinase family protein [Chryseoglobus sp. 28M-23]|uniref:nucleoside/nucleotide kinase family protein n=1 Tax=Chryseoglobus sp. 28M-23 TaxID=2772253 RepID=UPI001747962C|nr:nucleoside/nucleotide kinase family protein [Chryseoglobus sp. 28M-23]QOD93574.1 nucleoside/nucleotide kinase family protein [Chryseoglobus sp. 28M-23]